MCISYGHDDPRTHTSLPTPGSNGFSPPDHHAPGIVTMLAPSITFRRWPCRSHNRLRATTPGDELRRRHRFGDLTDVPGLGEGSTLPGAASWTTNGFAESPNLPRTSARWPPLWRRTVSPQSTIHRLPARGDRILCDGRVDPRIDDVAVVEQAIPSSRRSRRAFAPS